MRPLQLLLGLIVLMTSAAAQTPPTANVQEATAVLTTDVRITVAAGESVPG